MPSLAVVLLLLCTLIGPLGPVAMAMPRNMAARASSDLSVGADHSWRLMVEAGNGESQEKRITPKSVFIAPFLVPQNRAQRCKEGFRYDHMGKCVEVVKVDPKNQFKFFLEKLKFSGKLKAQTLPPPPAPAPLQSAEDIPQVFGPPSSGPLHFSIPIATSIPKDVTTPAIPELPETPKTKIPLINEADSAGTQALEGSGQDPPPASGDSKLSDVLKVPDDLGSGEEATPIVAESTTTQVPLEGSGDRGAVTEEPATTEPDDLLYRHEEDEEEVTVSHPEKRCEPTGKCERIREIDGTLAPKIAADIEETALESTTPSPPPSLPTSFLSSSSSSSFPEKIEEATETTTMADESSAPLSFDLMQSFYDSSNFSDNWPTTLAPTEDSLQSISTEESTISTQTDTTTPPISTLPTTPPTEPTPLDSRDYPTSEDAEATGFSDVKAIEALPTEKPVSFETTTLRPDYLSDASNSGEFYDEYDYLDDGSEARDPGSSATSLTYSSEPSDVTSVPVPTPADTFFCDPSVSGTFCLSQLWNVFQRAGIPPTAG